MGTRQDRIIEDLHVLHAAPGTRPGTFVIGADRPWSTHGFEVRELFWK